MARPDPQLSRAYKWEASFIDWDRSTRTLGEVRGIIDWACLTYGVRPPRVTQHPEYYASFSQDRLISFNRWQRNPAVALHEAAHFISDAIFGDTIAHHAPEWLGIYIWLLEAYKVAPRAALHASAKAAGLRWLPASVISPKRLRRGR